MKTAIFACVSLFCAVSLATDGQQREFPFKQAQGAVEATKGQSWSDFKVGGFKLQWDGSNGRVNFIRIQHFQFCVVPAGKMKFENITDPTQFLYRSLNLSAPITQSSKEPGKGASRFPTSPAVAVPNGSTLMLKYYNKYLALFPAENIAKSPLAYDAKLWLKAVAEKNAGELEFTVDEATGINTAKIAPMKEFFIPDIGKGIVFLWNPNPRFGGAKPGEYDGWVSLDFKVHTKLMKMWEGEIGNSKYMPLSDIDPFSAKLERITSSSGVINIGLSFPSPHGTTFIRLIKVGNKCTAIEFGGVTDEKIVFRWKVFRQEAEPSRVAQSVTQR